jgi:outer membrane protein assembly factor BamB
VGGGDVFVTANQAQGVGTLYGFDATPGAPLWSHHDPLNVTASGPVLANGLVYYDNGFGELDALIPSSGYLQAQIKILVAEQGPPIVDSGMVFTDDSGDIQADSP